MICEVCIVEKRGTGQLYAMKYMNKSQCMERDALTNVLKEVEILTMLEHPFLCSFHFEVTKREKNLIMKTQWKKKKRNSLKVTRDRFGKKAQQLVVDE
ncbi:hypothetical protein RUM43_012739 [Polyplax serrata]|uniref:Protein kinase domain-containing protein n=1 Tax=Polyplax serrata TaxID=468196 RepID=A0AAN8P2E7_POLSC